MKPRQLFCLEQMKKLLFTPKILSEVPEYVSIGMNVHIAEGVKFAPFGFGYEEINNEYILISHTGKINIADDVVIHENTVIVRATADEGVTYIGSGTKIDTNCHIAHNVHIGRNCLVISGSIIGGSVEIGDNCYLGIGCMIKNKVKIGNNVKIGMGSVVLRDVPDAATIVGNPGKQIIK